MRCVSGLYHCAELVAKYWSDPAQRCSDRALGHSDNGIATKLHITTSTVGPGHTEAQVQQGKAAYLCVDLNIVRVGTVMCCSASGPCSRVRVPSLIKIV